MRRRAYLASLAVGTGALAGCTLPTSDPSMLDTTLFNGTENPYTVELRLFRVGGDRSRSEA